MTNDRLDIIIFGATGSTGKHVVKNAIYICKEQKIKFGIAGRRKETLETVVKEFTSDIAMEDIPIIMADIRDEESLKKMTEKARIVINCCGPYIFYGEPVIKACIATRTHYIDVSGEEQFIERMQLEYNHAAQTASIYIVCGCGLFYVCSDLGIIFTQQKFGGEVNTVEGYLKLWLTATEIKNQQFPNYTTWESAIYSLAHANELPELWKKLYPIKFPEFTPKLKSRGIVHRSDVSKGWSTPFRIPFANRPLALHTQRFLYERYNERPAQVQFYATFKWFFQVLALFIVGLILLFMARITCGRNLLLKYPSLFSFGCISRKSPSRKILNHFSLTFKANGWSEKLAEPTDKHTDPPNKEVITKVSGDSSTYNLTGIIAILSTITILNEIDKIPDNGGVLTPGIAFCKTSLIEQMNRYNIKFEIISSSTVK